MIKQGNMQLLRTKSPPRASLHCAFKAQFLKYCVSSDDWRKGQKQIKMAENLQKNRDVNCFFLLDFEGRAALDCHLELLIRMVMTPVPLIIKSIITRFVFPSPGTFSFEFLFVRSGPEWSGVEL